MKSGAERSRFLLLWVLLFFCAPAPTGAAGEYHTIEIESLKVTIDSEWAVRTAPGYLPVRFDITNLGDARVIEIIGQGSRYFRGSRGFQSGGIDVRHAVRLGRGDRVRLTVPVPIFGDSENVRFEIREGGRTLERFDYYGFQSKTAPRDTSTLLVADSASAFGKLASTWPRPITARGAGATSPGVIVRGPSGAGAAQLDFLLNPARVPANWIGFTSVRAVVIGPTEWGQLNDDQKSALLTWTACGGDLIFVDGDLNALFPSGQAPSAPPPDRPVRGYFFGRIHLPSSLSVAAGGLSGVLSTADSVKDGNWALPANGAHDWGIIATRGFRLPIPGIDGVPARAYLSILIVFSLLIGPVNAWVLLRKRQQVLVVLTAPAISLVFIVVLAGYVVAGEGFGVRGRAVTFTMLDQVRKQASTRASLSLYAAGMSPSGGLRFPHDVAVFPIGRDGNGSRDRMTLDLTDGQRFAAGVIYARSPTNLEQIAFRPARERLSFSREAAGISVVNGLGTSVAALVYRDADNRTYSLMAPLQPGGRDILKVRAFHMASLVPTDLPQSARLLHLVENQPSGSYLAILERSAFWDAGVPDVIERGSFHLVIGWPEGQP